MRGLDTGAAHTAQAGRGPSHGVPLLLPPSSPDRNPRERLWRDLQDQLAASPGQPSAALSAAMCASIPRYSPAPLHAVTRLAYCGQAVETVQKVLYG